MPIILTQTIDTLVRNKDTIRENYGSVSILINVSETTYHFLTQVSAFGADKFASNVKI